MISLCPFTKDRCEEEACALWLKDLARCSIKEIAMRMVQSSDLVRELERLKVDISSIPHKIKIKT
ncbi:MAG: hypothetical protein ACTSRA_12515 [Promethearchaeota archaeon]